VSVVALDIGTSRTKALLAHWDGRVEAAVGVDTPTVSREPGELAFPAGAVWDRVSGLVAAVADAHADDPIDTLVLSCLGTAMVPLDRDGSPLAPAISPADARRSIDLALYREVALPPGSLLEITGQDPRTQSFLLHWLWWRRVHPEVTGRLARFRSLRGFVVHRLAGADAEDPSWASRTMLMDLETSSWSAEILAAAGLPGDVLPPIHPSTTTWPVAVDVAGCLRLAPGARVVLGGMDNCCAILGATEPGEERLVNIAGTYEHMAGSGSLEVARSTAEAVGGLVHRYLLPDRYVSMSRVALGHLLRLAADGSPGGLDALLDGVRTDPVGERMVLDDEAVHEALRRGTPPGAVVQRMLETAGATMVRSLGAWEADGRRIDRVVVVGGGAARGRVLGLKANLAGRPLSTLAWDESAGLGALRLAAMAVRGASPADAVRLFPNPIVRSWSPGGGPGGSAATEET
jgi:sugar (pentulose or hexulose) kinase